MKNVDEQRFVWCTWDKFVVLALFRRPWWIPAMMEMTEVMGSYRCVTLLTLHSKFRDVTLARNVMKDSI